MTEYTLKCRVSEGDYAEAYIDADGDVRLSVFSSGLRRLIYASPKEFAEFARKVLDDAGLSLGDDRPRIGDRVEVVKYRSYSSQYEGLRGTLRAIDDDDTPYLVETEEEGTVWAVSVRKVTTPAPGNPFAAHIEEAKRLLEDTPHYGADVITLARELADRP
ncbi:hypothetical protein AQJ23_45140 [Streptomyces antibioticus]|nr:hypothetical protein [Streptomyces antibioticus]KUN16465.1 hypothetical protein AQJ23_45140 [Streptomyces antibioticus]